MEHTIIPDINEITICNPRYGMFGKNDVSGIYGKDIFRQRVTFNPTDVLAEGKNIMMQMELINQRCFHRTNSSNTGHDQLH